MPTTPPPTAAEAGSADEEVFVRRMRQAVAALPDVPPALEQRALALFTAARAASPAQQMAQAVQALLRPLTAWLTFDSWAASPLALGMRSLRSPTRHLLFSAEGRDIDLRIVPSAEEFALAGQILGPDESGQVHLLRLDDAAATPRTRALDDLGEFHLEGLAAGRYRLTLQLGGDEITLPPIEVGEPPN